jgi:heme-degrading monooxygenase HmoA
MPYMLIRHKVEDYAKWKPVFDAHGATRRAGGCKGGRLYRNANDPSEVVVVLEWESIEKALQFTQSPELREAMQQAGVADQPDVYFLEEVERLSQ